MKELTPEQTQAAVTNYRQAQEHMTNAVEELRKFVTAITNINHGKLTCFNPFDERGNGLNLYSLTDHDLACYRERLEKGCWKLLIRNTGIMDFATENDCRSMEGKINTGAMGTFSEENIAGILRKLKDDEGSYVKNIAREAFLYFSPNPSVKAPIRQKTVKCCDCYGSIRFSCGSSPKWEILEKALLLLDRKPLPNYSDSLVCRMNEAVQRHQLDFECPYFRAKFYEKSKTAHLMFTRMDLIDAINKIGRTA